MFLLSDQYKKYQDDEIMNDASIIDIDDDDIPVVADSKPKNSSSRSKGI